jgi:hypothetical protein
MPDIQTDGCARHVEVEGPARASADAVELARHRFAHVRRPDGAVRAALP